MFPVQFQCESGVGDYISRVDEPETCVYIMTVHTMKICHHPYLKPPHPNKPVPISCNPVLTQQEYEEYLEDQKGIKMTFNLFVAKILISFKNR